MGSGTGMAKEEDFLKPKREPLNVLAKRGRKGKKKKKRKKKKENKDNYIALGSEGAPMLNCFGSRNQTLQFYL
jgi:hypothetical protein